MGIQVLLWIQNAHMVPNDPHQSSSTYIGSQSAFGPKMLIFTFKALYGLRPTYFNDHWYTHVMTQVIFRGLALGVPAI